MAQPWFKFYPRDWQSDVALRSCSLMARGAWVEIIAIMHGSDQPGHLLIGGKAPSVRQLALLSGTSEREMTRALDELRAAAVLDELDGVIVSRRWP